MTKNIDIQKKKFNTKKLGIISLEIFAIILLIIFFFPFFLVIINSAKSVSEITLTPLAFPTDWGNIYYNFVEILGRNNVDYFRSFFNSVFITTLSVLAIGILSAMAAWVLVRTKTKYSFWVFMFFLAGMVIPFQVVMLPLTSLLQTLKEVTGIPFKDTYHGVILAYVGFGAPLSIFLFHGFIKSIPMDIEEAAIIDGCTKAQVFFKIILPILKPIFVTLVVLNGMWIWNDYLLPVLMIGLGGDVKTLPLSVANLVGNFDKEWGLILTSVLMAALPILILFFFAQKHIIKGMTSGAIK
ncbi:MAG: carbohydrate ABC transporter permease [Acholeplasmataceae bacterium]|nr:carbohydrate ABC transporter permease [Acholeplasmataceae bacterium]